MMNDREEDKEKDQSETLKISHMYKAKYVSVTDSQRHGSET